MYRIRKGASADPGNCPPQLCKNKKIEQYMKWDHPDRATAVSLRFLQEDKQDRAEIRVTK